jgi:hypothetical protein
MRRFFHLSILMGLVGIMALVAGSAFAGTKGTDRPFKGDGSGTTAVSGGPSTFTSVTVGTVNSTHLGKGAYAVNATQNWGLSANCAGSPVQAVDTGSMTLTAANGATVTGTISGTTCELAPFNNTTYGTTLTMTVTGGTGRFDGATGSIVISGLSTGPAGGPFSDVSTMTGTISY